MTITHDDIIRSIEALSPEEMEVFLVRLMERAGLSLPTAPVPSWGTMGAMPTRTMGEYSHEADLRLLDHGPDKIAVIKLVRELRGLGLKETRDLVESAPVLLAEGVSTEEARRFQQRLLEVGARVELV